MKKIFKYPLVGNTYTMAEFTPLSSYGNLTTEPSIVKYNVGRAEIHVPKKAMLLKIGHDGHDLLCAWYLVNENQAPENHVFYVLATGQEIPDSLLERTWYVGSSVGKNGLVWHVFMANKND